MRTCIFLNKSEFKTNGEPLPGTICDYQFVSLSLASTLSFHTNIPATIHLILIVVITLWESMTSKLRLLLRRQILATQT